MTAYSHPTLNGGGGGGPPQFTFTQPMGIGSIGVPPKLGSIPQLAQSPA